MSRTALVIGGTDGFSAACIAALDRHGWNVTVLHREPELAAGGYKTSERVQWKAGEAVNRWDIMKVAGQADTIIYPGTQPCARNAAGLGQAMLASALSAARAVNARLVVPANLHNFGPEDGPVLSETTPQNPVTQKGRIRAAMEDRLDRAAKEDGARVLLVRTGDVFGPVAPGSWISNVMVRRNRHVRMVRYPGHFDTGHAWAYLPDVGETVARLLARESELAAFESFHVGGHYLARGVEMAENLREIAGNPDAPIEPVSRTYMCLAGPFEPKYNELLAHRHLWTTSKALDNTKLVSFLGEEPRTGFRTALRTTLTAMGCIPRTKDKDMADEMV